MDMVDEGREESRMAQRLGWPAGQEIARFAVQGPGEEDGGAWLLVRLQSGVYRQEAQRRPGK